MRCVDPEVNTQEEMRQRSHHTARELGQRKSGRTPGAVSLLERMALKSPVSFQSLGLARWVSSANFSSSVSSGLGDV